MKRHLLTLAALVPAVFLPGAALWSQNAVPNSPPSLVPRRPAFQASGNGADPTAANPAQPAANVAPATAPAAGGNGAAGNGPATTVVSGDYILSPADTLEMSVFNEPSLTTQTRVAADGTVQFPLIGEIKIGGMAIREARELIRRKYNADYLVEPQVYLNVIGYAARHFTVLGQVNHPGTIDFPSGGVHLGLLEAIGMAGGFTRLANEKNVEVKRSLPSGDQNYRVNTRQLTSRGSRPFEVASGDVITVHESIY